MADEKKKTMKEKLRRNRKTLLAVVEDLNEEAWETAVYSEGDVWTAADLLRHLADSQNSMTRLMMKIRETGEGTPPDFDLARWNAGRVKKQSHKSPDDLLAQMESDQVALFQFIDTLDEDEWQKEGRHGSGHILSLEQICRVIADHEVQHAEDIQTALAEAAA